MAFKLLKEKLLKKEYLIWWTLLGVCVGIAIGAGLYNLNCPSYVVELIGYPGELLIRSLQELVLPLIVLALMTGVFNLRHTEDGTSRILKWSLLYYLLSMFLAVAVGLSLVYSIKPGVGTPFGDSGATDCSHKNSTSSANTSSSTNHSTLESILNIGRDIVPTNIVAAAAQSNFLGVMSLAIAFAFVLTSFGERAENLISLIEVCNDVIMKIIYAVICLTPLGIASLVASTILKACSLSLLLKSLGLYIATVVGGFFIHSFIILPLTVFVLSRKNPFRGFRYFLPALLMGLGTSSSAATMPVTMDCGEAYGCERSIVRFVIPLGTNVNRDGAALYEAVSVIFISQAHGLNLSIGHIFVVAITATLAAIGTASIPNGALVSMVTVLQAVNLSEYLSDVAILLSVDWFIGMLRTSVNIWGDACACMIVDTWNKKHLQKKQSISAPAARSPTHNEDTDSFYWELTPTS